MRNLEYQFTNICDHNRDGSYATRANRLNMLTLMARQLYDLGFRDLTAYALRGRHVNRLLVLWHSQALTPATISNRLSVLRWLAEKTGRVGILAKSNAAYGLPARERIATTSKAKLLPHEQLDRIPDPYIRISLQLQLHWGLRVEESLKMQPHQADGQDHLVLQGSWTKGGRARRIVLRTDAQRAILDAAKTLVPSRDASLIPPHLSYVQHRRRYYYWTDRVGIHRLHGLRHAFAQTTYQALTGFAAPCVGGPTHDLLTPEQRCADEQARAIISDMLGHGRLEVTSIYLGK